MRTLRLLMLFMALLLPWRAVLASGHDLLRPVGDAAMTMAQEAVHSSVPDCHAPVAAHCGGDAPHAWGVVACDLLCAVPLLPPGLAAPSLALAPIWHPSLPSYPPSLVLPPPLRPPLSV